MHSSSTGSGTTSYTRAHEGVHVKMGREDVHVKINRRVRDKTHRYKADDLGAPDPLADFSHSRAKEREGTEVCYEGLESPNQQTEVSPHMTRKDIIAYACHCSGCIATSVQERHTPGPPCRITHRYKTTTLRAWCAYVRERVQDHYPQSLLCVR